MTSPKAAILCFVALTFLLIGSEATWPCQKHSKGKGGFQLGDFQGGSNQFEAEKYSTPECAPHTTVCEDLCHTVSTFVRRQRLGVLTNKRSWLWYYEGVLDYYRCANAKKIVEVGVAWGAQTAYHLKHGADFIEEYHVVDPFLAGYDANDPMSKLIAESAPTASYEDISLAWYQGMSMDLGNDGMFLPNESMPPPGCRLRMHRSKSVDGAKLFGDLSVDAVFIDGLHTYEGVLEDIEAWMSKIRVGGSLIFNDFQDPNFGVNKAVWEMADRHNIKITMIDPTNSVFGGKESCIKGPKTAVRLFDREKRHRHRL